MNHGSPFFQLLNSENGLLPNEILHFEMTSHSISHHVSESSSAYDIKAFAVFFRNSFNCGEADLIKHTVKEMCNGCQRETAWPLLILVLKSSNMCCVKRSTKRKLKM